MLSIFARRGKKFIEVLILVNQKKRKKKTKFLQIFVVFYCVDPWLINAVCDGHMLP